MVSRECISCAVPWVSGISALLAGIFFLVECTSGQGAIKTENLPLSTVRATQGTDRLESRWVHWELCHEMTVVKKSCTLKIFCLDKDHITKACKGAGDGPFAAGVFSYMAGIGLLPLPVGYLTAATKKHVIMLVSISGAAVLFGCISFAIVAAEHTKFTNHMEELIDKNVPQVTFDSEWGGGLILLLLAWIFSWLVFVPTILWLVFWTPPEPRKAAVAAERMWQNARLRQAPPMGMMYQGQQNPGAPLKMPANGQPYGSQPVVMPTPYGQPAPQGNWSAASPKPKAPVLTRYAAGPAALRTSGKIPTPPGGGVQVQGNGAWTGFSNERE